MAIILNDPRYAALDQVGYTLGQKYGNDYQNKKTTRELSREIQSLQDMLNSPPTEDERNRANLALQKLLMKENAAKMVQEGYMADIFGGKDKPADNGVASQPKFTYNIPTVADRVGGNPPNTEATTLTGSMFKVPDNVSPTSGNSPQGILNNPLVLRHALQVDEGEASSLAQQYAKERDDKEFSAKNYLAAVQAGLMTRGVKAENQKQLMALAEMLAGEKQRKVDEKNNSELISIIFDPQATDKEKMAAMQRYVEINGKDGGTFLEKLAPRISTAVEDTGKNINYLGVKGPNVFGIGKPTAEVIRSTPHELTPGQVLQGQQNDRQFWANYNKPEIRIMPDGNLLAISSDGVKNLGNYAAPKTKNDIKTIMDIIEQEEKTYATWLKANEFKEEKTVYPRQHQLEAMWQLRDQIIGSVTGQSGQQDGAQGDPRVIESIDRALRDGYSPDEVKEWLQANGYSQYVPYVKMSR